MTGKRRAKSSISRLPEDQKAAVERLLREGRLTLDEMIAELQRMFPGEAAADLSRSALHRYERGFSEMTAKMREIEHMSAVVVGELGESVGDKAGALLAQAITTLATNAALRAHERDDVSIDEIRKLAVAAKNALDTRRIDINARRAIQQEARERLIREQAKALENVVKTNGLSAATADALRKQILGIHQ